MGFYESLSEIAIRLCLEIRYRFNTRQSRTELNNLEFLQQSQNQSIFSDLI